VTTLLALRQVLLKEVASQVECLAQALTLVRAPPELLIPEATQAMEVLPLGVLHMASRVALLPTLVQDLMVPLDMEVLPHAPQDHHPATPTLATLVLLLPPQDLDSTLRVLARASRLMVGRPPQGHIRRILGLGLTLARDHQANIMVPLLRGLPGAQEPPGLLIQAPLLIRR